MMIGTLTILQDTLASCIYTKIEQQFITRGDDMADKKLSVIIPLYNVEAYVAKAAESIASQAFDGLEVIVIDDGSTDNSMEVCAEHLQGVDTKFIRQENAGPGGARNTGIRSASGEYIMFLDGDDFLVPNAFDSILPILYEENPDVLFGRYHLWTPPDKLVKTSGVIEFTSDIPSQHTDYIIGGLPESSWGPVRYICRRDFVLYHEIYFDTHVLCEDVKWALLLLSNVEEHGKISFFNTPFYIYNYRRTGSTMNTYSAKRLIDLNKAIAELLIKYKDRPEICRVLVRESFMYINEYCIFPAEDKERIFESYMAALPLYKLSTSKLCRIATVCRNKTSFGILSWVLFQIKQIRRLRKYGETSSSILQSTRNSGRVMQKV